jgi:hypothetical protein
MFLRPRRSIPARCGSIHIAKLDENPTNLDELRRTDFQGEPAFFKVETQGSTIDDPPHFSYSLFFQRSGHWYQIGYVAQTMSETPRNRPDCVSQNGKAKSRKSEIVAKTSRLVRREGPTYDDWRYISRRVRQKCDLEPPKRAKKLPRILTPDSFRRFYRVVDQADDVQHALMLRLRFSPTVLVHDAGRSWRS